MSVSHAGHAQQHRFGLEHNPMQIEGPGFYDPQVCPWTRLNGLIKRHHR